MSWFSRCFLVPIFCILPNVVLCQSAKGKDFERLVLGDWTFAKATLNDYNGPMPRRGILPVMRYMADGNWVEITTSMDGDSVVNKGKWTFYPDTQIIIIQRYLDYSKKGTEEPIPSGHYERFKVAKLTSDSLVYNSMHRDGLMKFFYSKRKTN